MLTNLGALSVCRGPLVALAVALVLALAGRSLRVGVLAAAAGGAGVVAGWFAITGRLWVVSPQVSVDVVTELAAIALLLGLLCTWLGAGRWSVLATLLAALAAGWLLSGGPRHQAALRASWPVGLVVVVAVILARILIDRGMEPLRLVLAALTLAAALHVAGAPSIWVQLALVPAAAGLAMLALPAMPALVALPVAVDIAALACLVAIAIGRLPHLGFAAADAAAFSPLLAAWLLPRITDRLGRLGRIAPVLGCLFAGAIAVGIVWAVRQVVHR
jgi:hypothetical protein